MPKLKTKTIPERLEAFRAHTEDVARVHKVTIRFVLCAIKRALPHSHHLSQEIEEVLSALEHLVHSDFSRRAEAILQGKATQIVMKANSKMDLRHLIFQSVVPRSNPIANALAANKLCQALNDDGDGKQVRYRHRLLTSLIHTLP